MAHIVKCRICKQQMDIDAMDKSEWVMPNQKCYYHTGCYNDWKNNRNNPKALTSDETFWFESLLDYLYRDVKMTMDFAKINSQWCNFVKPGRSMTPKGIYFAIKYYYDVLHGDQEKAQGGIGIVPTIYRDAAQYWTDLEMRRAGTIDAIIMQIAERKNRPVHTIIRKTTPKKDKAKFSLDEI